jgi:hypothetical protein
MDGLLARNTQPHKGPRTERDLCIGKRRSFSRGNHMQGLEDISSSTMELISSPERPHNDESYYFRLCSNSCMSSSPSDASFSNSGRFSINHSSSLPTWRCQSLRVHCLFHLPLVFGCPIQRQSSKHPIPKWLSCGDQKTMEHLFLGTTCRPRSWRRLYNAGHTLLWSDHQLGFEVSLYCMS